MILAFSIVSCSTNNNDSSESTQEGDSDEFCEYDYITDSIGEEAVSHECAITYNQLEEIQWKWEDVKSPSMLARARASWKEDVSKAKKALETYKGDEHRLLDSVMQKIDEIREEKCRDYSVPANGVIQTLNICISQIDKIKSKHEFIEFRDARYGMLNDLDIIHLNVELQSRKIGQVKRLAETLKHKYEEKCKEYDVE